MRFYSKFDLRSSHSGDPCISNVNTVIENAVSDCNEDAEAGLNLMFITLFYTWHLAAALGFVTLLYFIVYR